MRKNPFEAQIDTTANGWVVWKDKHSETLREIHRDINEVDFLDDDA